MKISQLTETLGESIELISQLKFNSETTAKLRALLKVSKASAENLTEEFFEEQEKNKSLEERYDRGQEELEFIRQYMITSGSNENNKCCIDCLSYIENENSLKEKLENSKNEILGL